MSDHVEEIKQKLDIVNVIGEYLELKRAGNSFKAKCPFHNEKTPSFNVSPDRQIFHCFGCGEGGDMFTFVQKIEGIEFPEALRILAQKAGVEIEKFDPRITSEKNRLGEICESTTNLWQAILNQPEGKSAKEYIINRKLSEETVTNFRIGYSPDSWDFTLKKLLQEKYSEHEIFTAGITVKKEKGTGYYDRFRDRVIFPIQDVHGYVVGFTGRALNSEVQAKYINTPEGPIYHKGRILYGLDKAKQAIRKADYAIVVEGNMDVITAHQAGYKNVVACSGTALTKEQIQLVKRYSNNVALCFDSDEAGQTASKRSIDLLIEEEMNVKIIELVSGKDPDECINNNINDWKKSLQQAKLVMQYYFDKSLTEENLMDISKKTIITKKLLHEISKHLNKIEQDHWLKKLAQILQVDVRLLWDSMPQTSNNYKSVKPVEKSMVTEAIKASNKDDKPVESILTILLGYPDLINYAIENLWPENINNKELQDVYKKIILYYNNNDKDLSRKTIAKFLESEDLSITQDYLNSLILNIEQEYPDFTREQFQEELMQLIKSCKINFLNEKINQLNGRLIIAGSQKDNALENKISRQIQDCSEQLDRLK